jgi:hypothetical protein
VIGRLIASIGPRFGLRAARVPIEPAWLLRKVEPRTPALASPHWPFAVLLRRRLRAAGIATPDRVLGLRWSGQMTRERLAGLIRRVPQGLTEIYLHPATGAFSGSAPGYRYREEFEALIDAGTIAATREAGLELGGFSDFPDSGTELPLGEATR